jgi:glutathione synthase/RimK-type ligase-like ATP-grasp enzyme
MNHPLYARNLLEHNKLFQLKLAEASGLIIPDTVITNSSDHLIEFCENHNGSIAVKTLRSSVFQETDGVADGIYTNRVSIDYLKDHIGDISLAPIMAQEYVSKKLEFRVTIVGENIFACAIHSQDSERTKDDWRRYDFTKVKHESYNLPQKIKTALLKFMKACHLTFGAIDMILTPEEKYVFLEVNPNGQYGWIEDLTGLPISDTIAKLLANPSLK